MNSYNIIECDLDKFCASRNIPSCHTADLGNRFNEYRLFLDGFRVPQGTHPYDLIPRYPAQKLCSKWWRLTGHRGSAPVVNRLTRGEQTAYRKWETALCVFIANTRAIELRIKPKAEPVVARKTLYEMWCEVEHITPTLSREMTREQRTRYRAWIAKHMPFEWPEVEWWIERFIASGKAQQELPLAPPSKEQVHRSPAPKAKKAQVKKKPTAEPKVDIVPDAMPKDTNQWPWEFDGAELAKSYFAELMVIGRVIVGPSYDDHNSKFLRKAVIDLKRLADEGRAYRELSKSSEAEVNSLRNSLAYLSKAREAEVKVLRERVEQLTELLTKSREPFYKRWFRKDRAA